MAVSETLVYGCVTTLCALLASGGFWTFLQRQHDKNNNERKMLLGLAHDRLVFLSIQYINKGEITKEEFENIDKYLYTPYKALKGNGTVERLIEDVRKLPITQSIYNREDDTWL